MGTIASIGEIPELKHPPVPRDDPGAYSVEMAKASIEFGPLPTTYRHFNWRAALRQEGAERLIFEQALCFTSETPHYGIRQAAACPRAAQKTQTYRSLRFLQWQPWCRRQAQ
jgi:hypothetical protein